LTDSAVSNRRSLATEDAAISSLARETHTPRAVVKRMYEEAVAALQSNAKVRNFIDVIAAQRVKEQLRALKTGKSAVPPRP
jgi:hypothetical protein